MSEHDYNKSKYRYERKFVVNGLSLQHIELIVKTHPAMFSQIYYSRYINNIYFDYISMDNYLSGINGKAEREKFRIRWYGDMFGKINKPILELKSKKGFLGKKHSFLLQQFLFDDNFDLYKAKYLFEDSNIPQNLKIELINTNPVLLNRFRRKYFLSADRNFRLTLDSDIQCYDVKEMNNSFLRGISDLNSIIIELKYDQDFQDNAANIVNLFPFSLKKNSKYINGLQKVNFW